MSKTRRIASLGAVLLAFFIAAPALASINKSIDVPDNAETGSQSSVNGSISVGSGATVNGSVGTVNGTIRIDDDRGYVVFHVKDGDR